MIYPSIEDLTQGKYNRYTLVVATAKCARIVTDEYFQQREHAEKLIANKETEKSLASMIKKEYRDEKAVKNAINCIYAGEFKIVEPSEEDIKKVSEIKTEPSNPTMIFPELDENDEDIAVDEDEDSDEKFGERDYIIEDSDDDTDEDDTDSNL